MKTMPLISAILVSTFYFVCLKYQPMSDKHLKRSILWKLIVNGFYFRKWFILAVWKGSEYTSVFWNLASSNFHLKKIDAVNWIQWTMYLWPRHFDRWRANYQNRPFMFIESGNCYCLNCLSTAHIISDENFSFVRNAISDIKNKFSIWK